MQLIRLGRQVGRPKLFGRLCRIHTVSINGVRCRGRVCIGLSIIIITHEARSLLLWVRLVHIGCRVDIRQASVLGHGGGMHNYEVSLDSPLCTSQPESYMAGQEDATRGIEKDGMVHACVGDAFQPTC